MWIGEAVVFICAIAALVIGIISVTEKKTALYFQLIVAALGCHLLGYSFDVCEFFALGVLSEGYTLGYLGSIGCFLFLLTASFGHMDGILDDKTPVMKKTRLIALAAPLVAILMYVPVIFSSLDVGIKVWYALLWVPASFGSYFNLKHAIIPDMDFGFVRAIRPFNVTALSFTMLQLLHLTLWTLNDPTVTFISGVLLGVSSIAMVITARTGVKKWSL